MRLIIYIDGREVGYAEQDDDHNKVAFIKISHNLHWNIKTTLGWAQMTRWLTEELQGVTIQRIRASA